MNEFGFSKKNPNLRLAWDATVLNTYMQDPLIYFWKYVQGYRSIVPATALVWGDLWHRLTASFNDLLLRGFSRDEALMLTIEVGLKFGRQVPRFPDWTLDEISQAGKKDDHKKRNTYTLIRSLIWWEAEYRHMDEKVLLGPDNKPLLEQHFIIPLGMKAYTGEDYLLCGSMDMIVEDEDGQYVVERKHTARTLSQYYFEDFDPSVQIYTYDLVGSILLPQNPLRGVVVEACQTAVGFSRFERHEVFRTPSQRVEWHETLKYWISRAENDAKTGEFRMNPASNAYASIFTAIQKKDASHQLSMLESELDRQPLWNPLDPKEMT